MTCPACQSPDIDEDTHSAVCDQCGHRWNMDTGETVLIYCGCGEVAERICPHCRNPVCDGCHPEHQCREGMEEAQLQGEGGD